MQQRFTQQELEGYLEESLPAEVMAAVEAALRSDPDLLEQLTHINGRRDAGVHTVGEIWRRHRVSCPSRQDLGSYLLGVLPPEQEKYVKFHLEIVGCRLCQANVQDLQAQQAGHTSAATTRRTKYFQSSAGLLKRDP
jgi:anti-sigma factor RsiW